MAVCSTEEWIAMQRDYHCRQAYMYSQAYNDYLEGDWWYSVMVAPAYADTPRVTPDVRVVGKKKQPKDEVIAEAEQQFYNVYNDHRKWSICRWVSLCFGCGFSYEVKELDRNLYD